MERGNIDMSATFDDPVQQEIWATLRAMNEAWTRGNPDDLFNYFHRGMIAIIPGERSRLESGAACVAGWKAFREAARIHSWEEKNPLIRVYGKAAVVAYEYDMSFDMKGETIVSRGRDRVLRPLYGCARVGTCEPGRAKMDDSTGAPQVFYSGAW